MTTPALPSGDRGPHPVLTALTVGYLAGYAAAGSARTTALQAAAAVLTWLLARRA